MKKITLYYSALLSLITTLSFAQIDSNCWKMLSAGARHSIAITEDGTLFTWGNNEMGQLGIGSESTSELSPKQANTTVKFKQVAAGFYCSMAISKEGMLYGWGQNNVGQLTNGNREDVFTPEAIGTDTDWKMVYPSNTHVLALKTDGTLWGWGHNYDGPLGNLAAVRDNAIMQISTDTNWESISAARRSTYGLKTDGTIWSWGDNWEGQLGNGSSKDSNFVPTKIGTATNWASISGAEGHVLALKTDGTLWAWGYNGSGELGNGTQTPSLIPIQIGNDNDWAFINAEGSYSIAIKKNGTIWAWGLAYTGTLGNNTNEGMLFVPTQIGSASDWKSVTCGFSHVLALKTDGTLWAWGTNKYSNFGNGTTVNSFVPLLVECSSLENEKWKNNSLAVSPNPSSGIFNIQSNASVENVAITVSDLNGRIMHQSKAENLANKQLDLNHLQNGIYILNISNATYNYAQKLVKQ